MAHGTGNEAEICHMASTRPPSASQSSSQSCPFPSRWGWPLTLSRTPSQSAPSMYLSNRSSLPHSGIASLPAMSRACCGCGVLSLFASSKPPPSFIPSFPPSLSAHAHDPSAPGEPQSGRRLPAHLLGRPPSTHSSGMQILPPEEDQVLGL